MSDHADERRDVRVWGDGYTVGQQAERERVQAALRALHRAGPGYLSPDWFDGVADAARALGVTLEQEGGRAGKVRQGAERQGR